MTLTDALSLVAGDTIKSPGLPDCGIGPFEVLISTASPARPEMGYAPAICGRVPGQPHRSLCIILDGSRECEKALSYWTRK